MGEALKYFFEHAPEIIKAASESPAALAASAIFTTAIIAIALFRQSSVAGRVIGFIVACVVILILSVPFLFIYWAASTGPGINVLSVDYGGAGNGQPRRGCIATEKIQKLCSTQSEFECSFKVDNGLCGDPAPGVPKGARTNWTCGKPLFGNFYMTGVDFPEGTPAHLTCPKT
jgi:hypothetical protein